MDAVTPRARRGARNSAPRPAADLLAALEGQHALYVDYNQAERADDAMMRASGHPYAGPYVALRRFFDGLSFASNSACRVYCYRGEAERADYDAPSLDAGWTPRGALGRFGHVYPAHANWGAYLAAAAAAGWPPESEPGLDGGAWHIRSTSAALAAALRRLLPVRCGHLPADGGAWHCALRLRGPGALALHRRIAALLRRHQRGRLARRSEADAARDRAELALADKPFFLYAGDAVEVNARQVLVPLLALGDVAAIERAVTQVLALVRQGYPFANVEQWLGSWCRPAYVAKLRARYAAGPSGNDAAGALDVATPPTMARRPSANQLAALRRFAAGHGRTQWKKALRKLWRGPASAPCDDLALLLQLRDAHGLSWLDRFRLPDD